MIKGKKMRLFRNIDMVQPGRTKPYYRVLVKLTLDVEGKRVNGGSLDSRSYAFDPDAYETLRLRGDHLSKGGMLTFAKAVSDIQGVDITPAIEEMFAEAEEAIR